MKQKIETKKVIAIILCSLFIAFGILGIIFGSLVNAGTFSSRDANYIYYNSGAFASNYSNYEKAAIQAYWNTYYLFEHTVGILLLAIGVLMILLSVMKLIIIIQEDKNAAEKNKAKVVVVDESGEEEKIIQKVEKMHALFEKGVLTEEEYSKIKNNLLNRM